MSTTPNLALNELASQGSDNVRLINEDLAKLDVLVLPRVVDRTHSTPPAAATGEAYIVRNPASGTWSGKDDYIAFWTGNEWRYIAPATGFQVYNLAEKCVLTYSGSGWLSISPMSEHALLKSSTQTPITSIVGVSWDQELLDIANSEVLEFDPGNPDRVQVHEAGDFQIIANINFNGSGSSAWNTVEVRLQTSSDGSSWSDVTGGSSFGSVRVTDVPDLTVCLMMVVNIVAEDYVRIAVRKIAGAGTVGVTANSRLSVRKVK